MDIRKRNLANHTSFSKNSSSRSLERAGPEKLVEDQVAVPLSDSLIKSVFRQVEKDMKAQQAERHEFNMLIKDPSSQRLIEQTGRSSSHKVPEESTGRTYKSHTSGLVRFEQRGNNRWQKTKGERVKTFDGPGTTEVTLESFDTDEMDE